MYNHIIIITTPTHIIENTIIGSLLCNVMTTPCKTQARVYTCSNACVCGGGKDVDMPNNMWHIGKMIYEYTDENHIYMTPHEKHNKHVS